MKSAAGTYAFRWMNVRSEKAAARRKTWTDLLLRACVWGGVVVIPLLVSPTGRDSFRYPKELLLRAEGIVIAVVLALGAIFGHGLIRRVGWKHPAILLGVVVVGWTAVATLASTNRSLSLFSFLWVVSSVLFFVGALVVLKEAGHQSLWLALAPAVVNAAILLLQRLGWWTPFQLYEHHLQHTALLGNPNDVGAYLVAPALAAAALVFSGLPGRLIYGLLAAFLLTAIVATHTLTAIGAIVCGLAVLIAWRLRRRQRLIAVGVLAILAAGVFAAYEPLRRRADILVDAALQSNYEQLLSYRPVAFFAAAHMFLDRPLLGVGPGCFGWQFFHYKIAMESQYPEVFPPSPIRGINFGEVHNDHLEILAEAGAPAYLLFLFAIWLMARPSLGPPDADPAPRARFAGILAFPLAVSFFVLTLTQFPLQLAAPTVAFLFFAAACLAWGRSPATR